MKKIVSSFNVNEVTVNLVKPPQEATIKDSKERLTKYLYKLLEMGYERDKL